MPATRSEVVGRLLKRLGATAGCWLLLAALLWTSDAWAVAKSEVGIVERLGEKLPLEQLSFKDEDGKPADLTALFDRPVVLALVYFRCAGICTPLLNGLSDVVQKSELTAGKDYRLITVSFDATEGPEMAKLKRKNMLKAMTRRPIPEDSWRFLTGDKENIRKLSEAVGFKFARDKNGQDFIHGATLTFITKDGMVARYLQNTRFNPADFEMAVIDAAEGRARSFMKKIRRLCFSYQPNSHSYVLQVNRIILGLTLLFVAIFVVYLLVFRRGRKDHGGKGDGAAATPASKVM